MNRFEASKLLPRVMFDGKSNAKKFDSTFVRLASNESCDLIRIR
jgi:hypothetical protein